MNNENNNKINQINSEMDDEKMTDQFKASSSNLNSNVRTRVNEWVSSFVTEMRSKRPAVVQKLVNSVPTSVTTRNFADKPFETETVSIPDIGNGNELETKSLLRNLNQINVTTEPSPKIEISTQTNHELIANSSTSSIANATKFWQKRPSLLSNLSKNSFEKFYQRSDRAVDKITSGTTANTATRSDTETTSQLTTNTLPPTITTDKADNSVGGGGGANGFRSISRAKINEFYNKLTISRNKFNALREQRMDAKNLIEEAKERLSASRAKLAKDYEDGEDTNYVAVTDKIATIKVCDTLDMDLSLDEMSHLSRSTENISDSLTMSMQSIDEGPSTSTSHLNVGRKIAIGEIGRSTSDNPRIRHKFNLGDIGRSFSESKDDEAIVIGDRHISAPTSSIAIENNNSRGHAGYLQRRAYSVSPTQTNVRRGILFRDQSLNEVSTKSGALNRESSIQSDSSRCSSVESLLDARRPDSEAILRHLGFGPVQQEDLLTKIPKRFLKPSQVRGIDTEAFMRQQLIASNIHEQTILGYRGLVGNPHVPPSLIVAKLMERFQINDERTSKDVNGNRPVSAPSTPGPNSFETANPSPS